MARPAHNRIILIGCLPTSALAGWKASVPSMAGALDSGDIRSLKLICAALRPAVLLLDADLAGVDLPAVIADFRRASAATRIIVVGELGDDDEELTLFRVGARGVVDSSLPPELAERAIGAVLAGELWIRRAITGRLFDEAAAAAHRAPRPMRVPRTRPDRLERLTTREREIAVLVSRGESNKRIAQQLSITERTVKAHLTEIFRKSGVGDRLNLALLINGRVEV